MKLLITGASGEFGRLAVQQLLQQVNPADLILISRSPDKLAAFAEKGCEIRQGDFDESPDTLQHTFAGADKMLLISTLDIGTHRQQQHKNAIEGAVKAGVKHIVYTSSVGVNPQCPGLSTADHLYTENLLRDSGITYTNLRNSQYAEVYSNMIAPGAIAEGKLTFCSEGGSLAMISKADAVAAAVAVLVTTTNKHDNSTYEVSGPELLSFRDVVALVNDLTGKHIACDEVDDEGKLKYWDSLGVPRDFVPGMPGWASLEMVSYERSVREGYFAILSHHFKLITGRNPKTLREVFLENKSAWSAAG